MIDLLTPLQGILDGSARSFLEGARGEIRARGPDRLAVLLPQLSRRLGRKPLDAKRVRERDLDVDLAVWRACDAAGALLLADADAPDDVVVDLYLHGDMEERTIVLRSLALRPVGPGTIRLLGEVQRTNTAVHVEAGALDSNLVVRALDGPAAFDADDFRRMVLKLAFMDLPAWRLFGALDHADTELSRMLIGYATEREAAGRSVWVDTYRFIGRAPAEGAVARLLGGIEHGSDPVRRAAAEGLGALGRQDLVPYLRERLVREPHPAVTRAIESAIAASG
jgi:hypothetical protein